MFNLKIKSQWHQTSVELKCGANTSSENTEKKSLNFMTRIILGLFEFIAIVEIVKYIIIPLFTF